MASASTDLEIADGREDGPGGGTRQLVTFTLGNEEYGIDIMAVREIKVWTETTTLPNSADFVRGVINLRGVIVPIFDLRDRFGQGRTTPTNTHVVIIIAIGERTIGILVDAVSDIISVMSKDVRPVPKSEAAGQNAFLTGLITVGEGMVALIDVEELFNRDSLIAAEAASTKRMAIAEGPAEQERKTQDLGEETEKPAQPTE